MFCVEWLWRVTTLVWSYDVVVSILDFDYNVRIFQIPRFESWYDLPKFFVYVPQIFVIFVIFAFPSFAVHKGYSSFALQYA